jgi:hypothetical protein
MIDSFYKLLEDHKAEDTNQNTPFIRKTKGGKLIIDIEDLKCLSNNGDKYEIIKVLKELEKIK